jgi:hypothetical protein
VTDSPGERARAAARRCESAGLASEADMLYRLALCRLAARRAVETAERLANWRVLAGPG